MVLNHNVAIVNLELMLVLQLSLPETLDRQFNPTQPNQLWVTDMRSTASQDIRTHEGCLYLAVIIDLFSRLVVGWSMKSKITTDLVLDALLMAFREGIQRAT